MRYGIYENDFVLDGCISSLYIYNDSSVYGESKWMFGFVKISPRFKFNVTRMEICIARSLLLLPLLSEFEASDVVVLSKFIVIRKLRKTLPSASHENLQSRLECWIIKKAPHCEAAGMLGNKKFTNSSPC